MLTRLHLHRFRNYQEQGFSPHPALTFITGENGSGKTSLLEAIYVLASGKSFRTGKHQHLIKSGEEQTTLFAEIRKDDLEHRIGISRNKSQLLDARIDGKRVSSLSDIARLLPVQILQPETIELIEGGSSVRRRFLDWAMFHVEHDFLEEWRKLKVAVEQRNALLKQAGAKAAEFEPWNRQLVQSSGRITALRLKHLPLLQQLFKSHLARFDGIVPDTRLSLYQGWAQDEELAQALEFSLEQDLRRGFTGKGAHRADLLIRSSEGTVRETFSRGQQKIVAYALMLAQIQLLTKLAARPCLVLVDDIGSELDDSNIDRILAAIQELGAQTIITSLNQEIRAPGNCKDYAVFHVEHGVLQGPITLKDSI